MDYGQFSLRSGIEPGNEMDVLDRALEGEGFAQGHGLIVVISPHRYNFAMPVLVEVWAEQPSDDVAAWEEVVQAGLEVRDDRVAFHSPTMSEIFSTVPSGRYAVRISGRDFVDRGAPGSSDPGDSWRIQFWPVDELPALVRLARFVPPPPPEPEALPEAEASDASVPGPAQVQEASPYFRVRGIRGGLGTPDNPSSQAQAWLATGLPGVYDPNVLPPGVRAIEDDPSDT
jgi:hypothetical protein